MNSFELFWKNKRLIQATQKIFHEFLKAQGAPSIEAKEPEQYESPSPYEVINLGLMRLNSLKNTCAVVIGFSQAPLVDLFRVVTAPPQDGTAPADGKAAETLLLNALFQAIDVELKANQINIDPKSVISIPQKFLGSWSKVMASKSIRFPFTTPKGDLVIEIPLFDMVQQQKQISEFYGFPETTRILVVDDSSTSRKLSRHHLSAAGYLNVDESVDGQAALSKLLGSRPPFELVVADWHMPNMTGLELLKKIRSIPELKHLPVILVTGEKNKDEIAMAIKEGVSGYVVKPFEGETLHKALKRAHGVVVSLQCKQVA